MACPPISNKTSEVVVLDYQLCVAYCTLQNVAFFCQRLGVDNVRSASLKKCTQRSEGPQAGHYTVREQNIWNTCADYCTSWVLNQSDPGLEHLEKWNGRIRDYRSSSQPDKSSCSTCLGSTCGWFNIRFWSNNQLKVCWYEFSFQIIFFGICRQTKSLKIVHRPRGLEAADRSGRKQFLLYFYWDIYNAWVLWCKIFFSLIQPKVHIYARWPGFSWPRCPDCERQKAFICQVCDNTLELLAKTRKKNFANR